MSIPQETRKFACAHQPLVMESRDGQLRVVLHCPYCEIERLTREMIDERALHESEEQAFLSERDQLRRERDEYARCLDGGVDCAQEKLRLQRLLDMRPPYYCQNCECESCGNTFAVLDKG